MNTMADTPTTRTTSDEELLHIELTQFLCATRNIQIFTGCETQDEFLKLWFTDLNLEEIRLRYGKRAFSPVLEPDYTSKESFASHDLKKTIEEVDAFIRSCVQPPVYTKPEIDPINTNPTVSCHPTQYDTNPSIWTTWLVLD